MNGRGLRRWALTAALIGSGGFSRAEEPRARWVVEGAAAATSLQKSDLYTDTTVSSGSGASLEARWLMDPRFEIGIAASRTVADARFRHGSGSADWRVIRTSASLVMRVNFIDDGPVVPFTKILVGGIRTSESPEMDGGSEGSALLVSGFGIDVGGRLGPHLLAETDVELYENVAGGSFGFRGGIGVGWRF